MEIEGLVKWKDSYGDRESCVKWLKKAEQIFCSEDFKTFARCLRKAYESLSNECPFKESIRVAYWFLKERYTKENYFAATSLLNGIARAVEGVDIDSSFDFVVDVDYVNFLIKAINCIAFSNNEEVIFWVDKALEISSREETPDTFLDETKKILEKDVMNTRFESLIFFFLLDAIYS